MIYFAALFSVFAGAFTAACVCNGIKLKLYGDVFAGALAVLMIYLASKLDCGEGWPYLGIFIGYGLTVALIHIPTPGVGLTWIRASK